MKYWGDCIQDMNRPLRFLLSLTDWCVTEKLGHFNIKKKSFSAFWGETKGINPESTTSAEQKPEQAIRCFLVAEKSQMQGWFCWFSFYLCIHNIRCPLVEVVAEFTRDFGPSAIQEKSKLKNHPERD